MSIYIIAFAILSVIGFCNSVYKIGHRTRHITWKDWAILYAWLCFLTVYHVLFGIVGVIIIFFANERCHHRCVCPT